MHRDTIYTVTVTGRHSLTLTATSHLREGTLLHSSTVSLHINVVTRTKSLKSEDSFFFVLAFIVGPSLAVVLLIGTIITKIQVVEMPA